MTSVTHFCLQDIVLITKSYNCFFKINSDTKLQFGNVCHCSQQTVIESVESEISLLSSLLLPSRRCCHLCSPEVWAHEATAADCYVVCPFQMVVQHVVIRGEADCAFFLHFMPPGRPCLPTSNTCILTVHCVQGKCFHSVAGAVHVCITIRLCLWYNINYYNNRSVLHSKEQLVVKHQATAVLYTDRHGRCGSAHNSKMSGYNDKNQINSKLTAFMLSRMPLVEHMRLQPIYV